MENASKALIIAGAILLSILIIAIGMSIYTSAQSTITSSITAMSTQEKDAFNNQFTTYEGAQTGSKVKSLIGVLIANANTFEDEPEKIPTITIKGGITVKSAQYNYNQIKQPTQTGNIACYVQQAGQMRSIAEEKHTYYVEVGYGDGGIINEVIIYYKHKSLGDNATST